MTVGMTTSLLFGDTRQFSENGLHRSGYDMLHFAPCLQILWDARSPIKNREVCKPVCNRPPDPFNQGL